MAGCTPWVSTVPEKAGVLQFPQFQQFPQLPRWYIQLTLRYPWLIGGGMIGIGPPGSASSWR